MPILWPLRSPLLRYQPPIWRRPGFSASPGQIAIVLVLVLLYIYIYQRPQSLADLMDTASELAFLFPALILSLSFHEFAHALVAKQLGDDTAQRQGRLTLNPIAHLDPLGTLMLVFTLLSHFGIGWAKPVPVNQWRLRPSPRVGMALVAVAGPISNLLLAFVAFRGLSAVGALPLSRVVDLPAPYSWILQFAVMNVYLAVFNLIPIPPLDGYRVLVGLVPELIARGLGELEQFGPMLLLMLVFFGGGGGGGFGGIILLVVMFFFLSNIARSGRLQPLPLLIVGGLIALMLFGGFSLGSLIAVAAGPILRAMVF